MMPVFTGTKLNDVLNGGNQNDTLLGLEGDDVLSGGKGKDFHDGGAGTDTVSYASAASGIVLSFTQTDGSGIGSQYAYKSAGGYLGDAEGDTFASIEAFIGSAFRDLVGGGASAMVFSLGGGDDVFDTNYSLTAVDTVYGEAGNDTAWGGRGDDVLHGGDGNDYLNGELDHDTLVGGLGNDNLIGDAGNDLLEGGAGADSISGGAGVDTADYRNSNAGVSVNIGNNTASGGHAQGDVLSNLENVIGSAFNDTLTGNVLANVLTGGFGSDTLSGLAGDDTIDGGDGDDRIYGGVGADQITGGAGEDTADYRYSAAAVNVSLVSGSGTGGDAQGDTLLGVEHLAGSNFDDELTGNDGDNRLVGREGADTLIGNAGNDTFDTGGGYDHVDGGAGVDTVTYDDSWDFVEVNLATGSGRYGEAARDTYVNVENVTGSRFDDRLTGDASVNRLVGLAGNDTLDGGGGNDVLVGGVGADTLIGGSGDRDAASYQDATAGVVLSLATGGTGGDAAGDTFTGIEFVYGSAFDDSITGDGAVNRLTGGNGNDALDGAAGNDYLLGEAGNDTLTGGLGDDVFVFAAGFGNDVVSDFAAGAGRTDRLSLSAVGIHDFAGVLANAADSASGVVIAISGHGTITLAGVSVSQLHADDFIFA
jgi:Ca2+-binding RTX toxin-like protein